MMMKLMTNEIGILMDEQLGHLVLHVNPSTHSLRDCLRRR